MGRGLANPQEPRQIINKVGVSCLSHQLCHSSIHSHPGCSYHDEVCVASEIVVGEIDGLKCDNENDIF